MSEPFIGQLTLFPYNFPPRGWAFCQGQILSIAQNTALFSLLGTTYGGNGQTTFALPDLRGRAPIGAGQGPGLSNISLGEVSGSENITLLLNNMPAHNHSLSFPASSTPAISTDPGGKVPAAGGSYSPSIDTTLSPATSSVSGGNQPFPIRDPYLGLNWCIALEGIFPSRN